MIFSIFIMMWYPIKSGFKQIFILSVLLVCTASSLLGQQIRIEKVRVSFDTSAVPELFYQVPIGLTFTFEDKSVRSTRGLLQGNISWNKIDISTQQGKVEGDRLYFDPVKVWENHHQVSFKINYRDSILFCNLKLPYIQKIEFNLYTDSLKKDVPFYLNVEGVFSSGKVLPLDTEKIEFQISEGKLDGNVLKYSGDSSLKEILVVAHLKMDSEVRDSIVVPIKTLVEKVTLPTEAELLRSWHKKR